MTRTRSGVGVAMCPGRAGTGPEGRASIQRQDRGLLQEARATRTDPVNRPRWHLRSCSGARSGKGSSPTPDEGPTCLLSERPQRDAGQSQARHPARDGRSKSRARPRSSLQGGPSAVAGSALHRRPCLPRSPCCSVRRRVLLARLSGALRPAQNQRLVLGAQDRTQSGSRCSSHGGSPSCRLDRSAGLGA
jgi:hypothetical protein